jgi:hypothetical protein
VQCFKHTDDYIASELAKLLLVELPPYLPLRLGLQTAIESYVDDRLRSATLESEAEKVQATVRIRNDPLRSAYQSHSPDTRYTRSNLIAECVCELHGLTVSRDACDRQDCDFRDARIDCRS